jgi:pyruvate dehydrogenase E2 component (dihydrolipoamide acetyltransferase)
MPSLGADMEAGTLVEWLVKPGDHVSRGDIVAVVETEKAAIEIETFNDGVVEEILVPEGQKAPVGAVLALIGNGGSPEPEARVSPVVRRLAERLGVDLTTVTGTGPDGVISRADVERAASGTPTTIEAPPAALVAPAPSAPPPTVTPSPVHEHPRIHVSPLAAAEAQRLGVDLKSVTGTGPGGAITRSDVERTEAARGAPEAGGATPPEPPTGREVAPPVPLPAAARRGASEEQQLAMRRAIAELMTRSKREIPHYYLGTWIDLSRSMVWLDAENRDRAAAERILPAAVLLKAVALAVQDVPDMNGFWINGELRAGEGVHVGVAVSLRQGGLIAPCIHDVDALSLDDLMTALRDLVQRARGGRLRSSEMSDPTITVSNMGDQGVETLYGVIYPPQVALVGFGKILDRPWAEGGLLGVRTTVHATLSADHRASDGHQGGLFLAAIDRRVQRPEAL